MLTSILTGLWSEKLLDLSTMYNVTPSQRGLNHFKWLSQSLLILEPQKWSRKHLAGLRQTRPQFHKLFKPAKATMTIQIKRFTPLLLIFGHSWLSCQVNSWISTGLCHDGVPCRSTNACTDTKKEVEDMQGKVTGKMAKTSLKFFIFNTILMD